MAACRYKHARMNLHCTSELIWKCIFAFQSQPTESHETAEYIKLSYQGKRLCSYVIGNEEIFKNTENSAFDNTSLQICTGNKNKC